MSTEFAQLKLEAIQQMKAEAMAALNIPVPATPVKKAKPAKAEKQSAKAKDETTPSPQQQAKGIMKARRQQRLSGLDGDKKQPAFTPVTDKEKAFAKRELNLEDKIKVEVKKGLWVYVDPDADIAAIKAKYNKR